MITTLGSGALVGVLGKALTDRWSDRRRRESDRQLRIMDAALKAAADLLTAADRLKREHENLDGARRDYELVKGRGVVEGAEDIEEIHHVLASAASDRAADAHDDAQGALAVVRLLLPTVADTAQEYVDLCGRANLYPDSEATRREEVRQHLLGQIHRVLGVAADRR